jgi:hypothetical protein
MTPNSHLLLPWILLFLSNTNNPQNLKSQTAPFRLCQQHYSFLTGKLPSPTGSLPYYIILYTFSSLATTFASLLNRRLPRFGAADARTSQTMQNHFSGPGQPPLKSPWHTVWGPSKAGPVTSVRTGYVHRLFLHTPADVEQGATYQVWSQCPVEGFCHRSLSQSCPGALHLSMSTGLPYKLHRSRGSEPQA